jgi:sterol desaturase/sphingolipid hydroxylase (fatty acid hydroxylase superfamily)
MSETLLRHEPVLRLAAFLGVLGAMALWERALPRRRLRCGRRRRWPVNLGLSACGTLLVRLLFPAAAVGTAALAAEQGWGLLRQLGWPRPLVFAVSVLALDLAVYLQHVVLHAIPALWRLHLVHHADLDFDTTTGLRFHPVEILISMFWKVGVVLVLGAPPGAVLAFEVLLNATSMFNHGNARLPLPLDRVLRWIIVTPDMHRVHHSVHRRETNSNFGFNLSCWDRLLGTYRAQPADGHEGMTIGLEQLQQAPPPGLWALLALPLRTTPGRYPIAGAATHSTRSR